LVARIAKLDHDMAAVRQKTPVSEKRDDEVVDLLISMSLTDGDQAIDRE
jgi:hypothetical protein